MEINKLTNTEPSIMVLTDREGKEILRIEPNGDFFKKGRLIENDKKITDALKDFLKTQGYVL
tara:strand:- start:220 stop:405 length:186 start_codon:yes stop_codon:yes gene_type:complete